MTLSSSFVAPSAVAILSTVLLWGPAASQTGTGSPAPLPSITVDAPKHVARPHRPEHVANAVSSRRASSTARTSSSISHVAWGPPGSALGRLGKLEKSASSCNGGCETSFKTGNEPWVGCSHSGGYDSTFSPTCRDTLTYKTFAECVDTKQFLGERPRIAMWICTSLLAGGKLAGEKHEVAELTRSGRPR
jgi:hypothetical protein